MKKKSIMVEKVLGCAGRTRLKAGGKVMDIGSGSGTVLVSFAEAFPTCQVIGIEPLPYFVDRSRRLIQERGLDGRVRVESVGAEQITFDPSLT